MDLLGVRTVKEELDPPSKRVRTSKHQLQTGHDCLFTEEPPKHLQIECSICLCVLCDPRLIDCDCGACFCTHCIEATLKAKKPCPLCNGPFTTSFPDRRLQRTLNSLEVYCSLKEAGCEWVGEMGTLLKHLNLSPSDGERESGCQFVELECAHCEEEFQRKILGNHERNECLSRPYKCACCDDYKSTFEDVTTSHVSVCPCQLIPCTNECGEPVQRQNLPNHLETTCPLELIDCSFRYAGCEVKLQRKDLPAHIKDNLAEHMSLQAISTQRQLEELKSKYQSLQSFVCAHLQIMPLTLIMSNFSEKKEAGRRWFSEPFYTHSCGYKMNLAIDANGDGTAKGTHTSLFFYTKRSNFDNQLKWPFRGSIHIELLDQVSEKKHYSRVLKYDDRSEEFSYPEKGGWGFAQFIAHSNLSPMYLKNDSLCFRLSYRPEV